MKHWWNFGREFPKNGFNLDVPNNKKKMQTKTNDQDPQLYLRQFNSKEVQERRADNTQEPGKRHFLVVKAYIDDKCNIKIYNIYNTQFTVTSYFRLFSGRPKRGGNFIKVQQQSEIS